MALEVWPSSLPQSFLVSGYGEATPEDNVLTDDYKLGPPVYRRRTVSAPAPYMGQMFMTTAEWETLSTFFHSTLFDGVMRFLFPPQAVADTARFWISRFVSPPMRRMSDADDGWLVSLSLERLGIGQVFVAPPLFSDPTVIYTPTVVWDQQIIVARHNNTSTFYAPSIRRPQTVTAGLLTNTNTVIQPEIVSAYIVITFAEVEANT